MSLHWVCQNHSGQRAKKTIWRSIRKNHAHCTKSQFLSENLISLRYSSRPIFTLKFWLVFCFKIKIDFLDKKLTFVTVCIPSLFRMQNYFFRRCFSCTILCFKSTYWNIPLWSFQRLKICGAVPKPPWPRKSFEKNVILFFAKLQCRNCIPLF